MAMAMAFLGLGANLGDPRATIERAIEKLGATARARMYRSRPLGPPGQPDYFNTAVTVETALEPRALLDAVKAIERELGRVPSVRWGPRAIDIDILMYGDRVIDEGDLRIPHRELANRRFVLAPLADLAPELVVPGLSRTVRELYDALGDDPADVVLA